MHDHTHTHCPHEHVKFCAHCQCAYCKDCGFEWRNSTVTYPTWWYRGQYTLTGAMPAADPGASSTVFVGNTTTPCDHKV